MRIARLSDGVVVNIESVLQEWLDANVDPDVIPYTDDNPAYIGGDYVGGYFYPPQPYPSWTRSNGTWLPPVPRPTEPGPWLWDEESQEWAPA